MTEEIWKRIDFAPDYEISTYGRVKSYKYKTVKILKANNEPTGYAHIALCVNGKYIGKRIHQLVAHAFIANPNNLPQVNHIDANKGNNYVSNLEWVTCKENIQHAFRMGLVGRRKGEDSLISGGKNHHARLIINLQTGIYYETVKFAAIAHNIPRTTLSAGLNGYRENKTMLRYA